MVLEFLEVLTEWRHRQCYECEQGAGPLIAQFLDSQLVTALSKQTKQMPGFALTVVHLNTKQANMLTISESGGVSVELCCTHGNAAAKEDRAKELAAKAEAA